MAGEAEPPFVSAAETKGGPTPRPNGFLLIECNGRVRSVAAPATGARRSGRHHILGHFWIHQLGNRSRPRRSPLKVEAKFGGGYWTFIKKKWPALRRALSGDPGTWLYPHWGICRDAV